jgi:hypothetical protein
MFKIVVAVEMVFVMYASATFLSAWSGIYTA